MAQQFVIDNRPSTIDWVQDESVKRVLQNAKNLLMTRAGEVPYDRFRGFNTALLDLPISRLNEELLPELDRVMLWEPRVEVVDAMASINETNDVLIECTIEIDLE